MKQFSTLLFVFFVLLITTEKASSQININSSVSTEKYDKSDKFEYYLTQLNTVTEADDIVSIFKARPGIVDAVVNLSLHKITIYSEQGMLERDILEVIKFAGKRVITEKEISKYY